MLKIAKTEGSLQRHALRTERKPRDRRRVFSLRLFSRLYVGGQARVASLAARECLVVVVLVLVVEMTRTTRACLGGIRSRHRALSAAEGARRRQHADYFAGVWANTTEIKRSLEHPSRRHKSTVNEHLCTCTPVYCISRASLSAFRVPPQEPSSPSGRTGV